MEIYSSTTRFALACNQSSKIIEPIQSRCAIVRYSRLSDQEVLERLMVVAREEKARRTALRGHDACCRVIKEITMARWQICMSPGHSIHRALILISCLGILPSTFQNICSCRHMLGSLAHQ